MIKTLICISNYGNKQKSYLDIVLEEYSRFNNAFDISVVLFSTQNNENLINKYPSLKITEKIYDEKIGFRLPYEHKEYMSKQSDNYDLFIYTENDIRITSRNVEKFIELSKICDDNEYIPGFLRFEICNGNDFISILDCHPMHSRWMGGNKRTDVIKEKVVIGKNNFFVPWNVHQGCYVLTKNQYKKILSNHNYFNQNGYARMLETAATGVYGLCGFKKIISYDYLEDCLVHHLPNKYCKVSFSIETVKRIYKEIL